ncbi:MAG: hypothetical protein QOF51_3033 [Chloroflexota bacterium]|nr:hypothetical protein [Chloroflexota bacterium]
MSIGVLARCYHHTSPGGSALLTKEENELFTRTGPGTPMGALLRRYWVPALLATELPEPDGVPVRVTLLGEELLAFRDSAGRVGLVDRHCPHRGASLFFGRNEESGLRCVYHGWKYDVSGQCVDMPNEPAESNFKDKIRVTAYPCHERGGVIWTFMGPAGTAPPLPDLEWVIVPDDRRVVSKRIQECNWLQALEGGVDLAHLSFLHRNLDTRHDGKDQELTRTDPSPRFEVVDTDAGLLIAARRNADAASYYWRISQFIMPWYTMFPPLIDQGMGGHAWVPIDDTSCWAYSITWNPDAVVSPEGRDGRPAGKGIYGDLIPGTWRPRANRDNDYLVDRAVQRAVNFTGIPGIAAQDCAVQESMGVICDRTAEHLGSTDVPLIAVRRRLKTAVDAHEAGREPPGLEAASQRVRPAALVLPRDIAFQEGAAEALIARSAMYLSS